MRRVLWIASLLYLLSVGLLLLWVVHFLQWHQIEERSLLWLGGVLLLLVIGGWWYLLFSLYVRPHAMMEAKLKALTDEILHELKIPIATIRANTTMIAKHLQDDPRSLRRVTRIEDATYRLERLYQELSYQLRKETEQIEKERFALGALIEARVAYFREQHRNPIVVTIVADREIVADRIGFEQMFDNLVTNAMKYAPKETPITITLSTTQLRIKDEGIGMEPTTLMRVMEQYYQADSHAQGQGIGLALVKRYCDSEGIDIHIYSEKGKGTEVVLDLRAPLKIGDAHRVGFANAILHKILSSS